MQESFGVRLRARREARGISIRGLAALASLNPGNVLRFERDEIMPKRATVERLAEALGLLPAELLGSENELPALRPYLRAAYGMDEAAAADVERYMASKYGTNDTTESSGGR